MPKQTVTVTAGGEQVSPEEYGRLTLRMCLEKRQKQLPATREAVDYAEACAAKLVELDAAIAADDAAAVQAILDWTQETHTQFASLRAA